MSPSLVKTLKALPPTAGVYLFYGKERALIYVGKAMNLKTRVRSYFQKGAPAGRGTKFGLREEVRRISHEALPSDIAALIREAELIKRYRPKYNVLMRDDKNYFYVGFTRETFPRVFITHQPYAQQIANGKSRTKNRKLKAINYKLNADFIGPFTSGRAVKTTLATLRRHLPYCICKGTHRGRCLAANLGLCPGWCCDRRAKRGRAEERQYKETTKRIRAVLSGRSKAVLQRLERAMRSAVRQENFEEAARARDAARSLENIFHHSPLLERKGVRQATPASQLAAIIGSQHSIHRIEGYDIANLGGTAASGSMVVFVDSKPIRDAYRKFRIKSVKGVNDPAMLAEVIRRRMQHPEWNLPQLLLLDGGRGQLAIVARTLKECVPTPWPFVLAALAKRSRSLYMLDRQQPIPLEKLPAAIALWLERIRDEAHRFSRVYHHWMRDKEITSRS